MRKIENKTNSKAREVAYTESKSLRDDAINNIQDVDFLDKIKAIKYLTEDMVLSTEQVAQYYDTTTSTIKTIISRNRDEFEEDGMVVLKGQELKDFKAKVNSVASETELVNSRTASLTLMTKKSLLRTGMIMTNNSIATRIRNYLLECERKLSEQEKSWVIQREVGIIERKRMTSAISKYIPSGKHKPFAYPNYTNMLYKTLFGSDAKTLREQRNVKTNDALRDNFTEKELSLIEEGETIVTALIALGFTYKQTEEHLKNKYIKQIPQK